ncbi:MAG: hypothetical protein AAGF11_41430 [Myxococcota bacterium]
MVESTLIKSTRSSSCRALLKVATYLLTFSGLVLFSTSAQAAVPSQQQLRASCVEYQADKQAAANEVATKKANFDTLLQGFDPSKGNTGNRATLTPAQRTKLDAFWRSKSAEIANQSIGPCDPELKKLSITMVDQACREYTTARDEPIEVDWGGDIANFQLSEPGPIAKMDAFCSSPGNSVDPDFAYIEVLETQPFQWKFNAASGGLASSAFVSTAIEGTAALIADRAQAELALWLVTDFSAQLCTQGAPSAKLKIDEWFPQTCELVKNSGEQPSGMLASAFRDDLEALPNSIMADAFALIGGRRADADVVGKLVASLLRKLQDGRSFFEALDHSIQDQNITCSANDTVKCVLVSMQIIAEHAADAIADGAVNAVDLKAILANTNLIKVLHDEVVANYSIPNTGRSKFEQMLSELGTARGLTDRAQRVRVAFNALKNNLPKILEVYTAASELREKIKLGAGKVDREERLAIFVASVDVAAKIFDLAYDLGTGSSGAQIQGIRDAAVAAIEHFARQEWHEGGLDALAMLVELQKVRKARKNQHDAQFARYVKTKCATKSSKGKQKKCKKEEINEYGESNKAISEAIDTTIRSLTFVVDAAGAETPEDFKAALDTAAAPLGGWRRKTERFSASFGAMAGLGLGAEFVLEGTSRDVGLYLAPRALVGLDLAGPVGKNKTNAKGQLRRRHSLGVFFSALDLGQLASERVAGSAQDELTDDNEGVEESPNIGITQVLSPGAYFRWGMFETPITLLIGASAAPDLRKVKDTVQDRPFDAWVVQLGAALAVDVTLFPLGRRVRRSAR